MDQSTASPHKPVCRWSCRKTESLVEVEPIIHHSKTRPYLSKKQTMLKRVKIEADEKLLLQFVVVLDLLNEYQVNIYSKERVTY